MSTIRPFVFRPHDGHARSVGVGLRVYLEGDLMVADEDYIKRIAPGYGGPSAFDRLSDRQVEALARAVGHGVDGLMEHLQGLPQVALNTARDRVRGIGDSPDGDEPEDNGPAPSEAPARRTRSRR